MRKKSVKIGRVVPKIWSRTKTDRQTDWHAHHNTPLPYRGRGNKDDVGHDILYLDDLQQWYICVFWLSGNGDYGVLLFADVQNWESVEASVHVVNADRVTVCRNSIGATNEWLTTWQSACMWCVLCVIQSAWRVHIKLHLRTRSVCHHSVWLFCALEVTWSWRLKSHNIMLVCQVAWQ